MIYCNDITVSLRFLRACDYLLYLSKVAAILGIAASCVAVMLIGPKTDPEFGNLGVWQRLSHWLVVFWPFAFLLVSAVFLQRRLKSKLEEPDVLS